MVNLNAKFSELIKYIERRAPFTPDISIILGSGLGYFSQNVKVIETLSSEEIPGYPKSTVEGHSGKIYFAEHEEKKVILFQGRFHFYEGYSLSQCLLPVFITNQLGCRKLLITNAAGGASISFLPGDLMLASSVNGMFIKKELAEVIGLASPEQKNNMLNFPSAEFNSIIKKAAAEENIRLIEGNYWYNKGPSYETPAEIKMAQKFGADAVGMSTAHEGIYAASLGIETSVISCITNFAAGISKDKLNHKEVIETANLISSIFERLVKTIIRKS